MAAVIKPNRSEINRAFPVAGFTIRTGVSPSWVEVAVATSPELLYGGSDFKSQRTASNFWSSRGLGVLPAERGEAVFLVPPQVLARFAGQDRLYYALATYRQSDFRTPQVNRIPIQTVPYITISRSFTGGGRGLMNVPNRAGGLTRNSNQYVDVSQQSLEWGGDTASPGEMVPVAQPANGTPAAVNGNSNGGTVAPTAAQPAANSNPPATQQDYDFAYDDGFGVDFWKKPKAQASAENYGMEMVAQSVGKRRGAVAAPLAEVDLIYNPTGTQQALAMQAEFNQRKQAWRVGVPDTSFYPHSAICHLLMPFTDGETYHGTGFYIAPNRILTCAHNVVEKADDNSEKYTAKSITITPGKNDTQQAAPAFTVQPSSWTYHPRYDGTRDFDLAVIEVNKSAPNGQYFPVLEELLESRQSPIIVCGYSSINNDDPDGTHQHLDGDAIRELGASGETFMYNLQTMGGASGSPVYQVMTYEDEEQQMSVMEIHIVGVHVSGFNPVENQGCRLTESKIAWINNPRAAASFGLQANVVRNNGHHSANNGNGHKTAAAKPNKAVAHAYEVAEDTQLPEYPSAKRFVPAKYFKAMPDGREIKRIVIHITDCPSNADKNWDVRYFQNPTDTVSAHYVVQQDGEVVQMVKHDDVAFHAHKANDDSIGIEHVANQQGLLPTEAEYCASAALVSWLCDQYNIPKDQAHIVGHREADKDTTHTFCPDAAWDWPYYMGLVTSGSCNDMPPGHDSFTPGVRVQSQSLATMAPDAVEKMKNKFIENGALPRGTRRVCIEIVNEGLRLLYDSRLLDSQGNRLRLGSDIQSTMSSLQQYDLAGKEMVFEFADQNGRLTRGVTRPDQLQSSVEDWILQAADANAMSGYYCFGLSILDGYHSLILVLAFSGIGNPDTHIYWCDQNYGGWDDVTGQLDARITSNTQSFWERGLPSSKGGSPDPNRKARTRTTIWPLMP